MLGLPTLIEIAVYTLIMSGDLPLTCFGDNNERVRCTNGLTAEVESPTVIVYSNGVSVDRNGGFPVFSDGTRSWLDSAGWVAFSTGVHVRRMTPDHFKFSTGAECRTKVPSIVQCEQTAAK